MRLGRVQLGDRQQAAGLQRLSLKVERVPPYDRVADRAMVRQKKTGRPVRFELTDQTHEAVDAYIKAAGKRPAKFGRNLPHLERPEAAGEAFNIVITENSILLSYLDFRIETPPGSVPVTMRRLSYAPRRLRGES